MSDKTNIYRPDPSRMVELARENRQAVLSGTLADARRILEDIRKQYPPGLERLERTLGVCGVILDLQDELGQKPVNEVATHGVLSNEHQGET